VTPAQLKAVLPALRSVSNDDIQAKITLADPHFDVECWGDFYLEGLANWVANELCLDEVGLSPDDGLEVSKSVGDTSFSLHSELVLAQAKDRAMRTRYGQRYRQLADLVGMGGVFG
jgi:hypothetical protein